MADFCNFNKNTTKIIIEDPKGNFEPVSLGYVQEYNVEEENEVSEEMTFDGICVNTFKYGKTTISFTRIIRYNVGEEQRIQQVLTCMKTDPMNVTAIFQRTSPDVPGNPVGKFTETWKNCRISSNKRDYKPDEEFKQEVELKSEGRLLDTETDTWEWLDDE